MLIDLQIVELLNITLFVKVSLVHQVEKIRILAQQIEAVKCFYLPLVLKSVLCLQNGYADVERSFSDKIILSSKKLQKLQMV